MFRARAKLRARRIAAVAAFLLSLVLAPTAMAETECCFDGQPVQEEDWAYPPFSPTLLDAPLPTGGKPVDLDQVDGRFDPEWRLYARSAGDDKMLIAEPAVNVRGVNAG